MKPVLPLLPPAMGLSLRQMVIEYICGYTLSVCSVCVCLGSPVAHGDDHIHDSSLCPWHRCPCQDSVHFSVEDERQLPNTCNKYRNPTGLGTEGIPCVVS